MKIKELIKEDRYFLFAFLSFLFSLFLFLNIVHFHSIIFGLLFLTFYLIINSFWLENFLSKIIHLEKSISFFFGFFFLIYLLGFGGAIFVAFYKITPSFVLLVLLIVSTFSFLLNQYAKKISDRSLKNSIEENEGVDFSFLKKFWFWFFFFFTYFFSLYFLLKGKTDKFILSPWQSVSPVFFYFFFILTFLLLITIFSRLKWKVVLWLIIIYSLLLHAYLPIVYQGKFGGDKWRHLAAERYLQEEKVISPALFGEKELTYRKIGPIKIPSVFVVGNKTSYSYQWALTSEISWLTSIDVFYLDLVLGFLLWSIFLPVFLFKIGQFFSQEKTFPLLLALIPNLFYHFQLYGSITVPVGLGFLCFLFVFIFWLYFLKERKKELLVFAIFLTLTMYLNYLLYFILLIEIGILVLLLTKIFPKNEFLLEKIINFLKPAKRKKSFILLLCLTILFFILVFPLLDIFSGLTYFRNDLSLAKVANSFGFFIRKLFGFSASYLFSPLIKQGNFIYLQTEKNLTSNTLLSLVFWPFFISLFIWLFVIYGIKKAKSSLTSPVVYLLSFLLLILLIDHFVGWYLMDGVRLFCKRSDLTIAFLLAVLSAWGIFCFVKKPIKGLKKKAKIYALSLFLALGTISSYASGPEIQRVTGDELKAAKYLWQEIQKKSPPEREHFCVLANTWPLLALEAESKRRIVTGGFPVYQEYAQPERVQLFKNMSSNPSLRYLKKSLEITQSPDCYFMTEEKWWNPRKRKEILQQLEEIFGGYKKIGEVYIFYYSPEKK